MSANHVKFTPWKITETEFTPQNQHHLESILTQGNGYLSTRASFEERYPSDLQATLIHGMWDDIPISFTELANAPDWTSMDIWINGKPFRLDQGNVSFYERTLDLQTGILSRTIEWSYNRGESKIKISFERFPSLDDQHILASQVKITPITSGVDVRVRTSINGHVENNGYLHWNFVHQSCSENHADLLTTTRNTSKTLAISLRVGIINHPVTIVSSDCLGCPGVNIYSQLLPGETLTIHKYIGIATSRDTNHPLDLAKEKALIAATRGYENIRDANKDAWKIFWDRADMVIEGDEISQLAIRHALFQLRIAAPTHDERVSIGAKTLSGFGYKGHVFWDTEIFILPFFTLTFPELSKNMLMYRWHTLPGARRKAAKNGYHGAQFSWESAETGDEVTPTWVPDYRNPLNLIRIWTGDIEIHITADIVYAITQYWQWTGDDEFWMMIGLPILFETAMFWADRAEVDGNYYSYRGIIGPDEYHEHVDNNAFTNYMAKWHLKTALDSLNWLREKHPEKINQIIENLDITEETLIHWKDVSDNIQILQDSKSGLFEQFEGFFGLKNIDLGQYQDQKKSIQEILGIEKTNEYQVIKQADVIMLLCLFRDTFDLITWQANWDYYNVRTDHAYGSSLGPSFYAWAACEMNNPDLAYDHFFRAAGSDLYDIRGNAGDGIHAASAGGLWQAIVFGFAGLNITDNKISVEPRLPTPWSRIKFKIMYQDEPYEIDIRHEKTSVKKITE